MSRKRHRISRHSRKASQPAIDTPFGRSVAGLDAEIPSAESLAAAPLFRVTCTDYSPTEYQIQPITDLDHFLAHHRPPWSHVRWINVEGFGQPEIIRALAEKYQLHPLALDDVLHTVQRPKAEDYPASGDQPGRLFVVARAIAVDQGHVCTEQVSFFLGRTTLLTFQEIPGDVFEVIRPRIENRLSRLRENDVSFLFYSLVDVVVDSYFPVLEVLSERLDQLEDDVLAEPNEPVLQRVHDAKRELLMLREPPGPCAICWPSCCGKSTSACPRPHGPTSAMSMTIAHRLSI